MATTETSATADLGPRGEEEWARLRTLLDLDRGRWVGFLFTGSPVAERVLRSRTDQVLRRGGETMEVIEPATPDDLRLVLDRLFEPWPAGVGCRWVSAIHTDLAEEAGPWSAAWEHLVLRLNDRRDALLRVTHRGLMFAATGALKPVARDGAPDLWGMRTMVLEVPGVSMTIETLPAPTRPAAPLAPHLATPTSVTATATVRPSPEALEAMREVSRQLSLGANDEAVRLAQEAVRAATTEADRALAQAWLSRAQEADGDLVQAVHSAITALTTGSDQDAEVAERIERLGPAIGSEALAVDALSRYVDRLRRYESDGSDLSAALDQLGSLRADVGDIQGAASDYAEALALDRRRLEREPGSSTIMRNLALSLDRVGDADLDLDDPAAARTHYQEALQLARRLLDLYGDTPQALRDLSLSLGRVGDTDRHLGDPAAARTHYQEALQLARRLLDLYGDTPQALRDLAIGLERVGDADRDLGDRTTARTHYQEAFQLTHRILDLYGETRQALDDVARLEARLRRRQRSSGSRGSGGWWC